MEPIKVDQHQFPVEQIRFAIENFLADKSSIQSKLNESQNIATFPITEVDSVVLVDLLIELESVIGCTLPNSLNKTGGYESVKQMQDDLLPKLEKIWRENFEEKLI